MRLTLTEQSRAQFARDWQREAGASSVFNKLTKSNCKCGEHTFNPPTLDGPASYGPLSVTGKAFARNFNLKRKHQARLEREVEKKGTKNLTRDRVDIAEHLRIMADYYRDVANGRYRLNPSSFVSSAIGTDGKAGPMCETIRVVGPCESLLEPKTKISFPFTLKSSNSTLPGTISELISLPLFKSCLCEQPDNEGKMRTRRGSHKNGYPKRYVWDRATYTLAVGA